MRVLIVGCGRLGSRVAEQLLDRAGDRAAATVFGMRRSERALPDGVVALRGDAAAGAFELPPDLDAVVYAVAAAGERSDESYRDAYPVGLGHVLDALERSARRGRVLFISSTGVYGEDAGGWVDEDTDPRKAGFTGVRLLEAEERLSRASLPGCSLRLSGLYGPTRQGALVRRVAAGEASYPASGARWMNQLHEEDAARAVVHVLSLAALPATLNVSDTRPSDRREVLTWLAERMRAPAPRPDEAQPAGAKRVSSQRLRDTGFRFAYPTYVEGYDSFLDARG